MKYFIYELKFYSKKYINIYFSLKAGWGSDMTSLGPNKSQRPLLLWDRLDFVSIET